MFYLYFLIPFLNTFGGWGPTCHRARGTGPVVSGPGHSGFGPAGAGAPERALARRAGRGRRGTGPGGAGRSRMRWWFVATARPRRGARRRPATGGVARAAGTRSESSSGWPEWQREAAKRHRTRPEGGTGPGDDDEQAGAGPRLTALVSEQGQGEVKARVGYSRRAQRRVGRARARSRGFGGARAFGDEGKRRGWGPHRAT